MTRIPSVWVLADERRGTASQAIGVAEALGVPYDTKIIRHSLLARLPNAVLGASLAGVAGESRRALHAPWPSLVVAAGRRAGVVARWIKRQRKVEGGDVILVQIMHPGAWGSDEFDLIAAPHHDRLSGANVMAVTGAPHGMTRAALDAAAAGWRARFAAFAPPVVALLLGGATRRRPFGAPEARALGAATARLAAAEGGSLVVTSSPRTGAALEHVLAGVAETNVQPVLVYRWGDDGDNPYAAILALADALVVTGDSVTMLSEACAGTKPVYLYAPPGFATAKHARLHRELLAAGYIRMLQEDAGARIDSWTHASLNAAGEIAAEIRRRFGPLFEDESVAGNQANSRC